MISQDYLKTRLHYDQDMGIFTWLQVSGNLNSHLIGKQAGRINSKGHRQIRINSKPYMAHHLAWLYCKGVWPDQQLDHKDRNKDNNAINNLRPATNSQNLANTGLNKKNTSGFKGVTFVKKIGKFKAQIRKDCVHHYLGVFNTAEEAAAVYNNKAKEFFGEFAVPNN